MSEKISTYYEPTPTGDRWYLAHWEKAAGLELHLGAPERIATGDPTEPYKVTRHNGLKATFAGQRIGLEEAHIIQSFGVWIDKTKQVHVDHFVPLSALYDPNLGPLGAYLGKAEFTARIQQWVDGAELDLTKENPACFDEEGKAVNEALANQPVHVITDAYYEGGRKAETFAHVSLLARTRHQDGGSFPIGVYARALDFTYNREGEYSIDRWFELTAPAPHLVDWGVYEAEAISAAREAIDKGVAWHDKTGTEAIQAGEEAQPLHWVGRRITLSLNYTRDPETWYLTAYRHAVPESTEAPAINLTYRPGDGQDAAQVLTEAVTAAATAPATPVRP